MILLTLFVRTERRAEAPLIDLELFRQGTFVAGNVAGLLSYAALFGLMFLMPFMFVRVYRDSALAAGLRLSIVPVMLGVVAPIGGVLYDRFGSRIVTAAGHAHLRRRLGLAVCRHGRDARQPAAGDARARRFRNRPGIVHLAQQQRDHGRCTGCI